MEAGVGKFGWSQIGLGLASLGVQPAELECNGLLLKVAGIVPAFSMKIPLLTIMRPGMLGISSCIGLCKLRMGVGYSHQSTV